MHCSVRGENQKEHGGQGAWMGGLELCSRCQTGGSEVGRRMRPMAQEKQLVRYGGDIKRCRGKRCGTWQGAGYL